MNELILGGQRSGKSRRAEQLAVQWLQADVPHREALFVATAQAHDDDMRARIARHRADRQRQLPAMQTVEETHDLTGVIRRHSQPHRLLVIDCLTLWLANHYDRIDGFIDSTTVSGLLQAIEQAPGPLVFVSNEIGLGVIPMGREVRAYVDALGWLNQQVAARCPRVCLMTAGLPLLLKGSDPTQTRDGTTQCIGTAQDIGSAQGIDTSRGFGPSQGVLSSIRMTESSPPDFTRLATGDTASPPNPAAAESAPCADVTPASVSCGDTGSPGADTGCAAGELDNLSAADGATDTGTVWFVGAGPGDPELLTVKGRDLIARAGAILFAGSLVSEAATRWAPPGCDIADSKGMTHEEICTWLIDRARRHQTVIRLQTGDPSLYGALIEMVQPLDAAGIPVRVVPGVSSAFAAAAAGVESLTLPEVSQTVILTRVAGRTPMPEGEDLVSLARHHCTLCIFLSITLLSTIQRDLREAGWPEDSPILVVHKASWPGEEKIVRATLATVRDACRAAKIVTQSMIIASPTVGARQWETLVRSRLYDASFTHRFRRAVKPGAS